MARIVCFGEILIRLSSPGKQLMLQHPQLWAHYAGAEANVAVSLARLGHDARIVSVLPDNALGQAARDEVRKHGVDTSRIRFTQGRMGLYFVTQGAGQRAADVLYDRVGSAFAVAAPSSFNWRAELAGADWLHISGVTPAVSASAGESALAAARAARAAGVRVSCDGNFRAKLWEARGDDPRPILSALFAEADLIFADARDIGLITGKRLTTADEAAAAAFAHFPNLTRLAATERNIGSVEEQALGGVMFTRQGATRTAARNLSGIVDRIGGGDAFAAGLLHGLAAGAGDQDMLDFAVGAACLKHFIAGDFNLASEADVRFYLSNSNADVRR